MLGFNSQDYAFLTTGELIETGLRSTKVFADQPNFVGLMQVKENLPQVHRVNIVRLHVVAPSCNLRCPYCVTDLAGQRSLRRTTTPELLSVWLELFRSLGLQVELAFVVNEPLYEKYVDWQRSILEVILKYKDIIRVVDLYSNGISLYHGFFDHPLLEPTGIFTNVVLTGRMGLRRSEYEHLSVLQLEKSISTLERKYRDVITVNMLFDTMDFHDPRKLYFLLNYNVKCYPSVIYERKSLGVSEVAKLADVWCKVDGIGFLPWFYDRLLGPISWFLKDIRYAVAGAPRIAVLDERTLVSVVGNTIYTLSSDNDFLDVLVKLHLEEKYRFDLCDCKSCEDTFMSKRCKLIEMKKCYTCPILGDCSITFRITRQSYKVSVCAGDLGTSLFTFALLIKVLLENFGRVTLEDFIVVSGVNRYTTFVKELLSFR